MIKNTKILIMLIILNFVFAVSNDVKKDMNSFFINANQAYSLQKYKIAIDLYLQVLESGVYNGAILYNLGNAYYKTGKVLESKYYYEKAYLFIPQDEDLKKNIALVNRNFIDMVEDDRAYGLKLLQYLKNSLSLNAILWMYTIIFGFGTILLNIHIKRFSLSNIIFIVYLIISILFIGISFKRLTYFLKPDTGIIWSERVEIKSGPDNRLATLFVLHQGAKVKYLKTTEKWLNIMYNNNLNGWVEKRYIKLI